MTAARKTADRDPSINWPTPERQAMGGFAEARTYEFEPDAEGRPTRRPIRTIRAADATAAARLAKYSLTPSQIMAASMFERDHETGRLEPKLTANMEGQGGGKRGDLGSAVMDARDRKQSALMALRVAGPIVVQVVEEIVLNAATMSAVAGRRTPHKKAGMLWANLALGVGLTMLEGHYRSAGRMTG